MEIIHIVLGKANPERMNGVNKVVFQLATEQKAAGMEVSVWGITKNPINNYGERLFETRLFKKSMNPFQLDDVLINSIREKSNSAIFHIHGGWVPLFSALSTEIKKNQGRYIFTPHGAYNTIAMKRSKWVKKIYFRLFERSVLTNAAKIHCLGQSEVTGLRGIYQTEKTFLLPYGFKTRPAEIQLKEYKNEIVVGFVGRLDIYTKGLDLLLDAFQQFNLEYPESKLWLIGDGPGRKKLEKFVFDKQLSKNVLFFGSKFAEEKDNLIKQMHVFVHPSRNEGLPSSVLEACNLGIPSIVSKATNVGEYIESYAAGIVVENDDVEDLIMALKKTLSLRRNGSLLQMRLNAQKMVQEVFNWETLINEYQQLYSI